MCGIIAYLDPSGQSRITEFQLKELSSMLAHRGPDDEGFYLQGPAALGHRRLSIVDIKGGHQPMTTNDGRYTIVFNGEIYDYAALRAELLNMNYPLTTHSDTETLLYAYAAWGNKCLDKLNGMFAFVIWDKTNQEFFAARDRMGMKPLYYIIDKGRAMFASELTPIMRCELFDLRLNHTSICNYLDYWYICEPQTMYHNVYQLPPGHYATIRSGQMDIRRYWHIPTEINAGISFGQAQEQLEALLNNAVKSHLAADVPVGTFLSGGIDSGLVTLLAAKQAPDRIQSFTIGFKDKSYDETLLAQLTASKSGVDLNVHIMEDITPVLMEEIVGAWDEPLGNASYVPTYLLAKAARSKLKVVLTGDGGDELFGGYPTYQAPYYQNMWQHLPVFVKNSIQGAVGRMPVSHQRISLDFRLKQLMQGIGSGYKRGHCTWRQVATLKMQEGLWRKDYWNALGGHDPFDISRRYFEDSKAMPVPNQLMHVDLNMFLLNDHLRKVDRMTMAHGLEARLPFLDHRVVEFAATLPAQYKVDMRRTKIMLKSIARRYLPGAVMRGAKKGLTAPIAGWIDGPLKTYVADQLKGGILAQLFDQTAIEKLAQDHWSKRKDNSRILWSLLTLQVWNRKRNG